MGFGADMQKVVNKAKEKKKNAVLFVVVEMSTSIIKLTPVDKGFAINNWQASIGTPDRSTDDPEDKNGKDAMEQMDKYSAQAYGNIYYLVNSMDYIKRLEDGWSKKGSHMVATTVANWKNKFRKALKQ